ncbi:MAG: hypothetical protein A2046_14980 [Bacteroidetes bacterium GWA2_30_7]|nr:MAG: hypothetical protein A2046_14980 [Bacteroidetes bacterium GWA2_30_7]
MNQSRNNILNLIREVIDTSVRSNNFKDSSQDLSDVYIKTKDSLELVFAQEFTKINGKFVFCENVGEFNQNIRLLIKEYSLDSVYCIDSNIQKLLENAGVPYLSSSKDFLELNVGVTSCESLIARTGSVLVSSRQASGRKMNVYPNIHIVIATSKQLVYDIKDAIDRLNADCESLPSQITLITGPSRTADIEKTLVLGAHGPKELYVFFNNFN